MSDSDNMNVKDMMKRDGDQRKGESGKVAVIGGSKEYVGAPALAGISALRSGCDYVTIICPEQVGWSINSLYPDLVTHKIKGDRLKVSDNEEVKNVVKDYNVVLLGNGIGEESKDFCQDLLPVDKPVVIDGDALKEVDLTSISNAILTPHENEFKTILETSNVARRNVQSVLDDTVIVVTGDEDTIITEDDSIRVDGGNPGLSKAGTGDVLAGVVTGFLGQGNSKLDSCVGGCNVVKRVGDILLEKKEGYSFIASDLVEEIKDVDRHF